MIGNYMMMQQQEAAMEEEEMAVREDEKTAALEEQDFVDRLISQMPKEMQVEFENMSPQNVMRMIGLSPVTGAEYFPQAEPEFEDIYDPNQMTTLMRIFADAGLPGLDIYQGVPEYEAEMGRIKETPSGVIEEMFGMPEVSGELVPLPDCNTARLLPCRNYPEFAADALAQGITPESSPEDILQFYDSWIRVKSQSAQPRSDGGDRAPAPTSPSVLEEGWVEDWNPQLGRVYRNRATGEQLTPEQYWQRFAPPPVEPDDGIIFPTFEEALQQYMDWMNGQIEEPSWWDATTDDEKNELNECSFKDRIIMSRWGQNINPQGGSSRVGREHCITRTAIILYSGLVADDSNGKMWPISRRVMPRY